MYVWATTRPLASKGNRLVYTIVGPWPLTVNPPYLLICCMPPSTKRHRVTAAEKLLLPFQVLRQQMSVDEVTLYTQEVTPNINESPLDWWKLHGSRYPGLQSLAAKYLGIPATSVPSERIFSKSGEIVSRRRASLKPSTVDMLVFLSKNLPILDLD